MDLSFSVIIPTYQEANYIEKVLQFCVYADPAPQQIIVVDGGSTDGTLDIVHKLREQFPLILLINNPDKYVANGLNLAIPLCKTDVIVRMDAHSEYESDYFKSIINTFQTVEADIVGGPTNTAFNSPTQEAIAYVYTSPFGMGNSSVHNLNYEGYTDSVTFGAWKTAIFKTTGLFDTSLKRNQDDEFHYRAKQLGFKIYQTPKIKLKYFPRNSLRALFKQYFQFGLYKPAVLKKVKTGIKLRHIIPSLLVLNVFLSLIFQNIVFSSTLIVYSLLLLCFSIFNPLRFVVKLRILLAFIFIHFAYGIGFLGGVFLKENN